MRRLLPVAVLVVALAGMIHGARGLRTQDTLLMLVSGAAAGAALAAVAAARRK